MTYYNALFGLLALSLLLIIGKLGEELFSKFNLIPFVGAIILGIIIGPGVAGVLYSSPYIEEFVSLGIIFILFMAGVEEQISGLISEKRAMLVGMLVFTASFIALYACFRVFITDNAVEAAVMAIVLGMVSAGPFSRTVQEIGGSPDQKTTTVFIEVLTMEISAIIAFAFISSSNASSSPYALLDTGAKVAGVILALMLFGKFLANPLFSQIEVYFHSREATISLLIGAILGFGFLAQYVGFNSAIAAFFLGSFMSKWIKSNAYMLEKLRAITYGLFEPMFFAGLGLYFVKLTPALIIGGIALLVISLVVKLAAGSASSGFLGINYVKNFFAISHEGGVDGAVLLTALEIGLVRPSTYSFVMVAVTVLALIAPLGYEGKIKLQPAKPSPSINFVKYELKGISAKELSNTLSSVAINKEASLTEAAYALEDLHSRVLIVLDEDDKPLGYVNDHEVLKNIESGQNLKISDIPLHPVISLKEKDTSDKVLEVFEKGDVPVIAVTNEQGKLIGTVLEREVLRYLISKE
ncbi:MAG: cation:proton antiporter [Thermoprotei archaeon]